MMVGLNIPNSRFKGRYFDLIRHMLSVNNIRINTNVKKPYAVELDGTVLSLIFNSYFYNTPGMLSNDFK